MGTGAARPLASGPQVLPGPTAFSPPLASCSPSSPSFMGLTPVAFCAFGPDVSLHGLWARVPVRQPGPDLTPEPAHGLTHETRWQPVPYTCSVPFDPKCRGGGATVGVRSADLTPLSL